MSSRFSGARVTGSRPIKAAPLISARRPLVPLARPKMPFQWSGTADRPINLADLLRRPEPPLRIPPGSGTRVIRPRLLCRYEEIPICFSNDLLAGEGKGIFICFYDSAVQIRPTKWILITLSVIMPTFVHYLSAAAHRDSIIHFYEKARRNFENPRSPTAPASHLALSLFIGLCHSHPDSPLNFPPASESLIQPVPP
jgi:hypothetical protein